MPELVRSVVPAGRMGHRDQPVLRADGLTLRPFLLIDAVELAVVYQDADIQRWHARSLDEDEAHAWITATRASWRAETAANWAVADSDGVLVGRVGFRMINLHDGVAEIAYWTAFGARRRGVATTAVQAISSWALDQLGLHRLELNHSTVNLGSCQVADRAGFAYEGTRREQVLHPDGWHDMHVHGRLASDTVPETGLTDGD